ncbi:hypothetical protein [Escherichia coli]|uniref:hypothetical protein n=1 Tax=Escherichia coli TaxID=562 RepID=UPI000A82F8E5|nr:hypothetical protein [Escherichia coli]
MNGCCWLCWRYYCGAGLADVAGWLMPARPFSTQAGRAAEQKPGTGKEQQPAY